MKKQSTTLDEIKCLTNQVGLRTPQSLDWGSQLCEKCVFRHHFQVVTTRNRKIDFPASNFALNSNDKPHKAVYSVCFSFLCEAAVGLDAGPAPTTVTDVTAPSWQSSASNVWFVGSCHPKGKKVSAFHLGADARIPDGCFVFLVSSAESTLKRISDDAPGGIWVNDNKCDGLLFSTWHLLCAAPAIITLSLV